MPVDPAVPTIDPEKLPAADQDVDPDALDDEDAQDERERIQRPEDWNEPPASEKVPPVGEPTPLSDDLR